MKKMVSLIGAGAVVITLGLGTGFAQQQTIEKKEVKPAATAQLTQSPASSAEKDKAAPVKQGAEVKEEKATTGSTPADMAADKVGKAASGKELHKTTSLKGTAAKQAKKPTKSVGEAAGMKPAKDTKPVSLLPAKAATEKATEKD